MSITKRTKNSRRGSSSQEGPVNGFTHAQLYGATHLPPLAQSGLHTAVIHTQIRKSFIKIS